ncbi:MAG: hypothetical protein B7Y99_05135 [Caulobacterales bacterium 32-69-10]|nr:MAG: hypothetical protein B7Y99_05135 [Caulobacterales bacterium 32-69-10]
MLLAAWGASTAARAAVEGACSHDGRRVALIDGVAWLEPRKAEAEVADGIEDQDKPDAPPQPPIRLSFASFPVDAADVARAEDREEAFRDQGFGADGGGRLELTVKDGAVTRQYLWMSPGVNLSYGSNQIGHYTPGAEQAGRVRGAYRFTPQDGQDLDCTVTFDLALLGDVADAPPLPGVPLPPDGGAPGAAYLALNRAIQAGDVDAMLRLLPADRAAELRKAQSSPEFAAMMAFAKAATPTQVHITGGRQDDDRAWVDFTAVEDGSPRVGVAEMKQQDGRWIMLVESTRDP